MGKMYARVFSGVGYGVKCVDSSEEIRRQFMNEFRSKSNIKVVDKVACAVTERDMVIRLPLLEAVRNNVVWAT